MTYELNIILRKEQLRASQYNLYDVWIYEHECLLL